MTTDARDIESLQDLVDHFEENGIPPNEMKIGEGFVFYID